jgi:hypothetical protein
MKLWGSVRQGAAKVAFEADKMVRLRKQETAIADVQKQVQSQYTALGEKVIELFQAGMIDHPQVAAVNQQIAELTVQITQLTAELEHIKADQFVEGADPSVAASSGQPASTWAPPPAPVAPIASVAQSAPAAETRPCPNCGAPVSATGAFCPECGQSLKAAQ